MNAMFRVLRVAGLGQESTGTRNPGAGQDEDRGESDPRACDRAAGRGRGRRRGRVSGHGQPAAGRRPGRLLFPLVETALFRAPVATQSSTMSRASDRVTRGL